MGFFQKQPLGWELRQTWFMQKVILRETGKGAGDSAKQGWEVRWCSSLSCYCTELRGKNCSSEFRRAGGKLAELLYFCICQTLAKGHPKDKNLQALLASAVQGWASAEGQKHRPLGAKPTEGGREAYHTSKGGLRPSREWPTASGYC